MWFVSNFTREKNLCFGFQIKLRMVLQTLQMFVRMWFYFLLYSVKKDNRDQKKKSGMKINYLATCNCLFSASNWQHKNDSHLYFFKTLPLQREEKNNFVNVAFWDEYLFQNDYDRWQEKRMRKLITRLFYSSPFNLPLIEGFAYFEMTWLTQVIKKDKNMFAHFLFSGSKWETNCLGMKLIAVNKYCSSKAK